MLRRLPETGAYRSDKRVMADMIDLRAAVRYREN
jgi:hypothetical protein